MTDGLIPKADIQQAMVIAHDAMSRGIESSFNPQETASVLFKLSKAIDSVPINPHLNPMGVVLYVMMVIHEIDAALPDHKHIIGLLTLPIIVEIRKLPGVNTEFEKMVKHRHSSKPPYPAGQRYNIEEIGK